MQIEGRQVENFDGSKSPDFFGQIEGKATIRVDDKTCPTFWLLVTLTKEEVLALARGVGLNLA